MYVQAKDCVSIQSKGKKNLSYVAHLVFTNIAAHIANPPTPKTHRTKKVVK